jgi:hypothetical protein
VLTRGDLQCTKALPAHPSCPECLSTLPLLTYPPTPSTTPPCHRALVGHFLFSAKFICMEKQKNRLTAIQTRNQYAQKNLSRARKFSNTPRRNAPRQPAPPMRPPAAARMQCTTQRTRARPRATYPAPLPHKCRPTLYSPTQMSAYPILALLSGQTSSPSASHFWIPVRPGQVLVRDPTYPALFPYK